MKVHIVVETESAISKRNHNKASNAAFRRTMEHHVEKRLSRHFEENADTMPGGAYNYAPRREKYTAWKQRRFGHSKPLVKTGRLARAVYNQRRSSVTATFRGATARIKGTYSMRPQRRREIEIVTREERKQIAEMIRGQYVAESLKYPLRKREDIT